MEGAVYPRSWALLVVFAMVFYVASYATGLGNVPWNQGELFALEGEEVSSLLPVPSGS